MCLHPHTIPPVPADTARVARAAFRKGNLSMRMRDEFGAIYTDGAFAALFPSRGQSAESPWRLALVTVMRGPSRSCSGASGIDALQRFAAALLADHVAMQGGLTSEWSNGLFEGRVSRLKLIKRQMYGRARFNLLRTTCALIPVSSNMRELW